MELYDRTRVSYPPQLIDDIITYSGIKQNGHILDVGCGTGQATVLFAQRGYAVSALDVSKAMVNALREKCAVYSNVGLHTGTFEDLILPDHSLDLIVSAMAWHWIKRAYPIHWHTGAG